jgi:hypothetical protein
MKYILGDDCIVKNADRDIRPNPDAATTTYANISIPPLYSDYADDGLSLMSSVLLELGRCVWLAKCRRRKTRCRRTRSTGACQWILHLPHLFSLALILGSLQTLRRARACRGAARLGTRCSAHAGWARIEGGRKRPRKRLRRRAGVVEVGRRPGPHEAHIVRRRARDGHGLRRLRWSAQKACYADASCSGRCQEGTAALMG